VAEKIRSGKIHWKWLKNCENMWEIWFHNCFSVL
jgi:hypothetical protein